MARFDSGTQSGLISDITQDQNRCLHLVELHLEPTPRTQHENSWGTMQWIKPVTVLPRCPQMGLI